MRCRRNQLWVLALVLAALVLASPQAANAQDTCSAGVDPGVVTAAPFFVGDTVRETLEIQVTSITGGTMATIDDATIKLGCSSETSTPPPISIDNCTADPAKSFVGFVSSTCPGVASWATSMPDANTVVFTAVDATDTPDPLELGPDSSCIITYDVQIDSQSTDSTPLTITQAQGFDAVCDNDAQDAAARGTLALSVDVCEVSLDKRVSCDGGLTYVDMDDDDTLEETCIGWEAFDGNDAEPVLGEWVITNEGTVPLFNCELTDSNSLLLAGGMETLSTPLETSQTVNDEGLCTDTFETMEPNTAMVLCACDDFELLNCESEGGDGSCVTDQDTANVECQQPGLELSKVCEPQDAGSNDFDLTATNTGEARLINCEMSDFIDTSDPECPAVDPMTNGTEVLLTGLSQPFNLAADGGMATAMGTVDGLESEACNTGFITCEIDDGTGNPVIDPNTELAKTISRDADDVCPVFGDECLTRTPGFYGTHPHVTTLFLPFDICGMTVDNVGTSQGSAIQNMCSVGKDPKSNQAYDQQIQLERQCTAAVLNVIATEDEFDASCENAYPGIADTIADCCGFGLEEGDAVCDAGLAPGEAGINDRTINSCIGALDAFNNNDAAEPEDLTGSAFEMPGPADPSVCQDSKNDGFINDGPDRAEVCKGKGCN